MLKQGSFKDSDRVIQVKIIVIVELEVCEEA
jgi:hypothetical protein